MVGQMSVAARIATAALFIALIVLVERHQPVAYFRGLTFLFVFFLLACMSCYARSWRRDGLLAAASLALALCLIEAGAHVFERKDIVVRTAGLYERQSVIGTSPSHPGTYHDEKRDAKSGAAIFSADYTIDSHLLRATISNDQGPAIVFFGDSMTFGVGVNDADTLPQLFADALDRKQRVVNLALGGHGPQQFLRELETGYYDARIGPQPKLFVFMTAAWHAERTACRPFWMRHAPRYEIEDGKVAHKGQCAEGAALRLRGWLEECAAYRVFVETQTQRARREDVRLYIETVRAAVGLAREKYSVPTLIAYIDSTQDFLASAGVTDAEIVESFRKAGAIVVDASLTKEEAEGAPTRIPGDGHPTPFANRARAALLRNYIEQHMSGILVSELE